ncbi:flagellar biosynthesis protein FliP [Niallia circulans]|uniref:flagellar type III secretion system pore protein FliP n=1 Tax=Niallia circulans TaxID=1397 RepID=UPI00077C68D1|nr:flagellar type III secretion system pore protein FliP [Niallia circulans]MDR4315576.1 flagellar type III secretion system pore protein FliP [Niallia circulans]MED3837177.1 flagellar type III secretion system pore protein FliP [Niallia circulans]MED4244247.1 flagellar type III secretion system pore protein FliP [Niallia circulans]MED4249019.1 flagellar type III secretion system pore protein FliP [Niallia circulans]QKH61094.1 flagellar type III secretion system pore protein FliP [Niallia circ
MNEFIQFFNNNDPGNVSTSVQLLLLLTVLSLAPSIIILLTSFTRIVIVLSFVRTALATQQMPPNQVIVGLALFLTFFIMAPTFQEVNDKALTPLFNEGITLEEAYDNASLPLKEFMSKHTRQKDLALFLNYSKAETPESIEDIPLTTLVPAFAISELKTAFQIGFMIFIPFLVIDMVVASILMSMGMMMLPPVMISLPFKILLFIMVDGWYLVVKSLLESF